MATPKKSPKPAKPAAADAKAAAAKAAKPAHVAPVVNLTNAAHSAAQLIAARSKKAAADSSGASVSAAQMKQLKSGLAQPQHAPTSLLAGLNKQPKPTGTAGYNRVGGHHQNNGANVARTGVPRRTGGG